MKIALTPRGPRIKHEGKTWPGRNHPGLGEWLRAQLFAHAQLNIWDPMIGVGKLWMTTQNARISGIDVSEDAVLAAKMNIRGCHVRVGNAEVDQPGPAWPIHLVAFSPPYAQAHNAGATDHQKQMMHEKKDYAIQGYSGPMPDMPKVYANIKSYHPFGPVAVILRNRIVKGKETDALGEHAEMLRVAGFPEQKHHYYNLLPTRWQQAKIKRDPSTPWIEKEWVILAWE